MRNYPANKLKLRQRHAISPALLFPCSPALFLAAAAAKNILGGTRTHDLRFRNKKQSVLPKQTKSCISATDNDMQVKKTATEPDRKVLTSTENGSGCGSHWPTAKNKTNPSDLRRVVQHWDKLSAQAKEAIRKTINRDLKTDR